MELIDKIERAHLVNVPPIPMRITYGWPIPDDIISDGVNADLFFRALMPRAVDTESILSKSTAGGIETIDASMFVFSESDKDSWDELRNWLQTIYYENEMGFFGKPATSYKDLGSGVDIIRIRNWHPVGGFAPEIIPAGKYFAAAQNVIIEIEQ